MADEEPVEVGAPIQGDVPYQPTPTSFGLGKFIQPDGTEWVVMEFHTMQGVNVFFFQPDVIAQQIAPALLDVVGQSALVVPSVGDISRIKGNGGKP